MVIDPSTDIGKLRLRVADYSDIPYLPDSVYASVLADNSNSLPRSAKTIAMYILGMMSQKTHRKMGLQLEVFGNQVFEQYRQFLMMAHTNPAFMDVSPVPYSASGTEVNPLIEFQQSWNKCYYSGTQSQQLSRDADISPNDGSRLGGFTLSGY